MHVSWTALKHETKVNVYYMSLAVYHYVSIVSIFYRKEVCEQTVGGQALDKVSLGFFKPIAKVPLVEVAKIA